MGFRSNWKEQKLVVKYTSFNKIYCRVWRRQSRSNWLKNVRYVSVSEIYDSFLNFIKFFYPRLISWLAGQSKHDIQSRQIEGDEESGNHVKRRTSTKIQTFLPYRHWNWRAGSKLPQIPHEAWRIKKRERKRQLYLDTRINQTSKNCHVALKAL